MEKKNLYIALGVLGAAILLVGGIVFYTIHTNSSSSTSQSGGSSPAAAAQEQAVPTLTPDDIGLSLTPTQDNQILVLKATKVSDVSLLEYELDYNAQSAGSQIPRGVIGKIQVNPGQSSVSQQLILGTCSDVCHYDTGVSDIKLTLKVTKTDGSVYSITDTASLQ